MHKAPKVGGRMPAPAEAFGQVRADRLARPAELIRQGPLLDRREPETGAVDRERHLVSPAIDLEILDVHGRPGVTRSRHEPRPS